MVTSFQTICHSITYLNATRCQPSLLRIRFFQSGTSSSVSDCSALRAFSRAVSASLCGKVNLTTSHISRMSNTPPTYSPTTNCHPRNTAITIPSSMTRLVEDNRNARDGTIPAPLAKSERVVASAAKEQELEIKPKNVPRPTLAALASPILFFMRSRVTNT